MNTLATSTKYLSQFVTSGRLLVGERLEVPGGLKPYTPTAEQKAFMAKQDAFFRDAAKQAAEQRAAADATAIQENNDVYYPNVASLDLETSLKVKGIVEVSIERNLDAGKSVFASYGDRKTSSPTEYLSWLNDHIAQLRSSLVNANTQRDAGGDTVAPSRQYNTVSDSRAALFDDLITLASEMKVDKVA